ncbi:hypothetical protein [Komagataeibacter sp. FNDCR2]|nr:hypothetical protein [Komagataeibacter sp. FNDCR2]MCE2576056.1 hypothetical protein [Komagataeibacter sp. FNDCR2]
MIESHDDMRPMPIMDRLPTPVEMLYAIVFACLIWGLLIGMWVVMVP